ncbi:hypothetical protein O181_056714 [Austropuccinia psidii MF-1]|uniref:Uncharacterized protein n=1 Tax=Austropuccinia psidii MF-1 TaxID=1389203 RepID=A0A9Q3HVY0_9BASI|nr:hypothetical protein [Austropuccinia psidii MF-1]
MMKLCRECEPCLVQILWPRWPCNLCFSRSVFLNHVLRHTANFPILSQPARIDSSGTAAFSENDENQPETFGEYTPRITQIDDGMLAISKRPAEIDSDQPISKSQVGITQSTVDQHAMSWRKRRCDVLDRVGGLAEFLEHCSGETCIKAEPIVQAAWATAQPPASGWPFCRSRKLRSIKSTVQQYSRFCFGRRRLSCSSCFLRLCSRRRLLRLNLTNSLQAHPMSPYPQSTPPPLSVSEVCLPPILRLPNELLEAIFQIVEPSFYQLRSQPLSRSSRVLYRIAPGCVPDFPTIKALLLVCRRFFDIVQASVYNIVLFPWQIDSGQARSKAAEIISCRHKLWIKGLRIGNPSWNRPLLQIDCLSRLLATFSPSLETLHLTGTVAKIFLNRGMQRAVCQLSKLTTLELCLKFHVVDSNLITSTINLLPSISSVFLGVFNLLPVKVNISASKAHPPFLTNLVLTFWDHHPAELNGLGSFLSFYAKSLKVLRLQGQLGPGLSEALQPVLMTLKGLELNKVMAGIDGLMSLNMPQLTTLALGTILGFLPYFHYHLCIFKNLRCLVLHSSAYVHPDNIAPFLNVSRLRHLVLMDFSGNSYSGGFTTSGSMERFRAEKSNYENSLSHSEACTQSERRDLNLFWGRNKPLRDWCSFNRVKLNILPRTPALDLLFHHTELEKDFDADLEIGF